MPRDRPFESAVIVGASSGIGAALARRLASEGTRVALLARRGDLLRAVAEEIRAGGAVAVAHEHDVRAHEEIPGLLDRITTEIGEPDLIIYSAGLLLPVQLDEFTPAKDAQMLAVNLVGAVAWLDHAAVRMGARGAGTIVGISSIAGDRGRRGMPAYCASKAGLTTFLESLRNRLAARGVDVVTVRPGFVDTDMIKGMKTHGMVSAPRAAEIILHHARRGSVDVHVPRRWGPVSFVLRAIPSWLFRHLPI